MGLLLLVILAVFVPGANTKKTDIASPVSVNANHSRTLLTDNGENENQHGFHELTESGKEERGPTNVLESMLPHLETIAHAFSGQLGTKPVAEAAKSKLFPKNSFKWEHEEVGQKVKEAEPKLKAKVEKAWAEAKENGLDSLATRLEKYDTGDLSYDAKKELIVAEMHRGEDFVKFGPAIKEYNMQKPAVGKSAPLVHMKSHEGRDMQRYDKDEKKMMSISVVVKPGNDNPLEEDRVLLIGSSKLTDVQWILPKGGFEEEESIGQSALREITEEAGIGGVLMHKLTDVKIDSKDKEEKGSVWTPFIVKADEVYDKYPENRRPRVFVSYRDAIALLKLSKREDMAAVLMKAMDMRAKRTAPDDALSKIKLKATAPEAALSENKLHLE